MCEEKTPLFWQVMSFSWKVLFMMLTLLIAVVLLAFIFEGFNMIDEAWGTAEVPMFDKQYSAVCPCRHGKKILTLPARSHDDQEAIKKLKEIAGKPPCYGCQEGFPRIFSLDVWFSIRKQIVRRYQVFYLGEEAP